METISFNCELCGGRIESAVSTCGQRVICPLCTGMVTVPERSATPEPAPSPPTPEPAPPTAPETERPWSPRQAMPEGKRHPGVRIAGWGVSVLIHALLILLFMWITWVTHDGRGTTRDRDVDVSIRDEQITVEEQQHAPLKLAAPNETAPPIPQPTQPADEVLDVQAAAETTPVEAEALIAVTEDAEADDFVKFSPGGTGGSVTTGFQKFRSIYKNRTGVGKAAALKKFGGKGADKAIRKGLAWLAKNQRPNGSWGQAATTGLALLAFLGDGNTTKDGKYKANVQKGFEYLLTQGRWAGERFQFNGSMYHHGIATFALAEECALHYKSSLRKTTQGAVNDIVAAQYRDGGWRYGRTGYRGDTSVFGWQIMALKAARNAELKIPASTWKRAKAFLESVKDARGETAGFGYQGPRRTWVLSGVGLVCLQFMGSRDRVLMERVARSPLFVGVPTPNHIYGIYYVSIGLFQMGGKHWTKWNAWMRPHLIGTQRPDGHWERCHYARSSAFPDAYSTALSVLTLEVYYRYTPLYAK